MLTGDMLHAGNTSFSYLFVYLEGSILNQNFLPFFYVHFVFLIMVGLF